MQNQNLIGGQREIGQGRHPHQNNDHAARQTHENIVKPAKTSAKASIFEPIPVCSC